MGVRESREGDGVAAMEKIKRAERAHGGNFQRRVSYKYPMCQLFFGLAFEWVISR
jgi:hypothetical protein